MGANALGQRSYTPVFLNLVIHQPRTAARL